mmetsp:Transcript_45293/g.80989  ORF Transcript_45293/g.80989 Transcript_45293/m.80989 type:complete len:230 (+) Transcript_45293:1199-1888(+)
MVLRHFEVLCIQLFGASPNLEQQLPLQDTLPFIPNDPCGEVPGVLLDFFPDLLLLLQQLVQVGLVHLVSAFQEPHLERLCLDQMGIVALRLFHCLDGLLLGKACPLGPPGPSLSGCGWPRRGAGRKLQILLVQHLVQRTLLLPGGWLMSSRATNSAGAGSSPWGPWRQGHKSRARVGLLNPLLLSFQDVCQVRLLSSNLCLGSCIPLRAIYDLQCVSCHPSIQLLGLLP